MSKTIFLDVQVPVYFEVRHLLNFFLQIFHFFTTPGGIEQPDGDCEAGRDPRLQRLWRPTHLYRLAQGGGGRWQRCLKRQISGEPADSQQRREVFHCRSQLLHRPDDQPHYKVEVFLE